MKVRGPSNWRAVAQAPGEQLAAEIAEDLEVGPDQIFNLIVNDPSTGTREVFNNLTIVESRRRIDRVLDNESALVRVPRDEDGAAGASRRLFSSGS